LAAIILRAPGRCYTFGMVTFQQSRRRGLESAINQVLPPQQRAAVREMCAAEAGRPCTALDVLSWMRVNMPVAADRVDDVQFPRPFND
jgi:hypothetical protein